MGVDILHPHGVDTLHAIDRTARTLPYRAAPGHARLDRPPDAALGTEPRIRHRPSHPRVVRGSAAGRHRLPLPRPAPARASEMDRGRVEQVREQTARAGLPPDGGGQEAAGARAIAMGAAEPRDRRDPGAPRTAPE